MIPNCPQKSSLGIRLVICTDDSTQITLLSWLYPSKKRKKSTSYFPRKRVSETDPTTILHLKIQTSHSQGLGIGRTKCHMVSWRNKNDGTVPLLDRWDICLFGPVVGSLVKFASNFCLSVVHLFFFGFSGLGGFCLQLETWVERYKIHLVAFMGGCSSIIYDVIHHIIYI